MYNKNIFFSRPQPDHYSKRNEGSVYRLFCSFAIIIALIGIAADAFAQSVIRGPYLQLGTPDSVTVHWRTDIATDSVVRFGNVPGNLVSLSSESGSRTEHAVQVTGLAADNQYFYSVGNSGGSLAGDDSSHFFRTSPPAGTAKPTRVWVIGDSGTADANAQAVKNAYLNYTGNQATDVWLMLGDNAYSTGTDIEYQAAVFNLYPQLLRQALLWPVLGNHDGASADSGAQTGPYYDIFNLPGSAEAGGVASGTEAYYSFDYGNIHFVALDSFDSDRSPGGAMLTWLENDLLANDKEWLIAFWHHPPYTKGSHNSDTESRLIDMRQNALPILDDYGVDLVLSGHSHSYERSFLLDGHYGQSTTLDNTMILDVGDGREDGNGAYNKDGGLGAAYQGVVYAVAGSSGKTSGGALNHPAMFISLDSLGSMVLDINGNRMDAVFLNNNGQTTDHFTITKGPDTTPPTISGINADDANTVSLVFSEPVDLVSAETLANYSIDQGISLNSVTLSGDGRTVVIGTSTLATGITYALTVNNVLDLAGNIIAANSQSQFTFVTLITRDFQDSISPTTGYAGTEDTFLAEALASSNFGNNIDLQIDGDDGGGSDLIGLMRWDLSSIPQDATVESASITLSVFNISNSSYEFYQLLRGWTELQANWNQASNGVPWASPGGLGASDRDTTILGVINASTVGTYTINLNSDGIAVIQDWVSQTMANYGFMLADSAASDGLDFYSSETTPAGDRPKLTVTYSLPATGNDTEAPSAPQNLQLSDVTSHSAALSWDASSDNVAVTGYKIYRDGQLVATTATNAYVDDNLQPSTPYDYTVSAVDAANNESAQSATLQVTTDSGISFQDGVAPDTAYDGTRDTTIEAVNPDANYGTDVDLRVDGDDPSGSGNDVSALLYWDILSIPGGSTIDTVTITLNVFNLSTGAYQLYELLGDWQEDEASWNQAQTNTAWQTAGAQGVADRGSQVLGSITASSTGIYDIELNADGIAVVQDWIDGAKTNHGFILANMSTTNGLDFDSREISIATNRPHLTIAYTPSANQAPSVTSPGNQSDDEGESVSVAIAASDPDSGPDPLAYSASGLPPGLGIDSVSGVISGNLSFTSAGVYNVTVTISDGQAADNAVFTWTVNNVNRAPTITSPGDQNNDEGDGVSLAIAASDPDLDPLDYSASGLPPGLGIDSVSGVISGTVDTGSAGAYTVTVSVSDGSLSDNAAFTWTVEAPVSSADIIYVSSTSGGSVGGVSFADEDILAFDTATATWSMYLDGSDVGLSGSGARDINAFTMLADDSVVFSVVNATTLPDVGSVDDSDLIRFIPTSTGPTTAGSFEFYFDGSDVGLSSNGEDIDSVSILVNGDILISTIGRHNVSGASGADEDLLRFVPTSLGTTTSGTWSRYFDGSDVDLGGVRTEDIYGVWRDEASGDIYLTTRGAFSVSGLAGDGADIFICTPGSLGTTTSCSYSLFWDGSASGYGGETMDGFFIQR